MEIEKKHAYLDEYKIVRTLGSGYHAEYFLINLESNWVRTLKAIWLPLKSIRRKLPPFRLCSTSLPS